MLGAGTPVRARRRPWIIASLVILVVAAIGVGSAVFVLRTGDGPTVEQRGRSALASAQLRLLDTPATHFTGTVKPTGASAGRLRVDLTVTNVGDATGTVSVREGIDMDYLGVGGKSFLRGSEQAWLALGESAEDAARYKDVPVLIGPERFGFDLASTLAPARLALALDPEAERSADVTVGDPIEIDGHPSTPITSGSITTYVRNFDAAGESSDASEPPVIDRIVSASSSGDSADSGDGDPELPEFTLEPESGEADDALSIYEELPGRVNDLGNAVDSRISVGGNINGQFLQNPCLGVCTIQFVITNTVNTSRDIRVTTVRFDYSVTMQSSVPVALGAGCNGSGTMPANGSTTLSCSATYDPQLIPAGQTRPITATIQVTVRALDPQQVTELQDKTVDRGRQVKDISQDAPNSYRRYTETGGTLPQPKWTQRYDRTSSSAQVRGSRCARIRSRRCRASWIASVFPGPINRKRFRLCAMRTAARWAPRPPISSARGISPGRRASKIWCRSSAGRPRPGRRPCRNCASVTSCTGAAITIWCSAGRRRARGASISTSASRGPTVG
ncbi:hypothetical protein [Nocardia cyriacigeorgica]|uniref:hypothetical protein n=1 Tax=Nocardia cyriacigeorgica TaxID=135487 RepID=UPI001893B34D|nr:hypothetical protein [Nocardia cyriacigeorgica]MBF6437213.1 hypothetical protein [Nocardia cyriacigeorgica]